jgi:hypothetical protein
VQIIPGTKAIDIPDHSSFLDESAQTMAYAPQRTTKNVFDYFPGIS